MSTRSTIIFINSDGEKRQFYHHWDGYPEWMGKALSGFLITANLINSNQGEEYFKNVEKTFLEFLDKEGCFEPENLGTIHGDIEYMWFVKINKKDDDVISYTHFEIDMFDKDKEIEKELRQSSGWSSYCKI